MSAVLPRGAAADDGHWWRRHGPLCLLWLACLVVGGWVWARWGAHGWLIGSFWWDELALSGAAHAVQRGMTPEVDFWAPFILPIYLKALAQSLTAPVNGYVLECLMQGGLVLLLATWLLAGRRHRAGVYWVVAWAVLQAAVPFNIGSIIGAAPGSVVSAGAYNRLGGALISLMCLALVVYGDGVRMRRLVPWLAAVLVLSFLTKITVFQVGVACWLAFAVLLRAPGAMKVSLWALVWSTVVLFILTGWNGVGAGYLSALAELSVVRSSLWHERLDWSRLTLSAHRLELFVLVMCALLVAIRGVLARRPWTGAVSWYLAVCGLLVLYTLTNFGDNSLFTAVAPLYVLLWQQEVTSDLHADKAGVPRHVLVLSRVLIGVWLAGCLLYGGFTAYRGMALVDRETSVEAMSLPVRSSALSGFQRIDKTSWDSRAPLWVAGVPWRLENPAAFATYIAGIDEALTYLAEQVPDRSKAVYALDFPAYVFAQFGGYRIPRHAYPWLLFGHEISIDRHPPAAKLFEDVDVLMTSTCSLSSRNRRYLPAIYRIELEAHWRLKAKLACWVVWQRKGS